MSLLHPPPGFPPHLAVIWPLIWVQVLVLRAAVRAAYGRGVQYHWSITPCGRVFLTSIDWLPGQTEAPVWLKPAAHPNARLAAALDGRAFVPAYARFKPLLPKGEGSAPAGFLTLTTVSKTQPHPKAPSQAPHLLARMAAP
jgi:hypothetical protein